ncbi:MAG TPA: Fe-S cluster assembly protein SufD [Thermoanaerobaculia bacterium]|nr:Fe-S cluster assembly protein SufD [Thermoanaerobaculia bacterium]
MARDRGRDGAMKTAVETAVLQRLRQAGAERFKALGWPTTRIEEWKYTSLAALAKMQWSAAIPGGEAPVLTNSMVGVAAVEMLFVNGHFHSMQGEPPRGISVSNLAAAADSDVVEQHLGRYADLERSAMTALNAANIEDGAVIVAGERVPFEGFIHLIFAGSGDGVWSHPRNLIVAGRGSQLTVVESFVGTGAYFTNSVTEIVAADGAVVDHYKIGCESATAYHVGSVHYHQERASSVTSRNVVAGGALVRNDITGILAGEGASLTLEGLFVITGQQHADNHTLIDHVSPRCESHEIYKGILDESARGIFDGRIIVRPNAQKTVSRQENRNLLLSEKAVVDSKPTLEIHNDDVKCNHGSTIGQLDEEAMFYLRSRGIDEEDARTLLVLAFASELVNRMKIEPVREQVRRALFRQMPERLPEQREKGR